MAEPSDLIDLRPLQDEQIRKRITKQIAAILDEKPSDDDLDKPSEPR